MFRAVHPRECVLPSLINNAATEFGRHVRSIHASSLLHCPSSPQPTNILGILLVSRVQISRRGRVKRVRIHNSLKPSSKARLEEGVKIQPSNLLRSLSLYTSPFFHAQPIWAKFWETEVYIKIHASWAFRISEGAHELSPSPSTPSSKHLLQVLGCLSGWMSFSHSPLETLPTKKRFSALPPTVRVLDGSRGGVQPHRNSKRGAQPLTKCQTLWCSISEMIKSIIQLTYFFFLVLNKYQVLLHLNLTRTPLQAVQGGLLHRCPKVSSPFSLLVYSTDELTAPFPWIGLSRELRVPSWPPVAPLIPPLPSPAPHHLPSTHFSAKPSSKKKFYYPVNPPPSTP